MDKNKQESFKVFNYLKKNPSVAIALVSSGVAFGTAIVNLLVYIKEKQYLDYWQISASNVFVSQGQLYFICASLALGIISVFAIYFIESSVKTYYSNIKDLLFYQKLVTYLQKNELKYKIEQIKSKLKLFKIKLINLLKKKNIDEEVDSINELFVRTKNISNSNIVEIKDLKKSLKKDKKFEKVKLAFKIIFAVVLICVTQYIYFSLSKVVVKNLLIYSLSVSIIEIIIYLMLVFAMRKEKKEVKKDVDLYFNGEKDVTKKYLNTEQHEKVFIDIFSDNSLKIFGMQVMYYFMVFLVFAVASTYSIASEKRSFYIYNNEGDNYALIYENQDNYIFEKIEVYGATLIVDTEKQFYVTKDNIVLEYREFENVERNVYKR